MDGAPPMRQRRPGGSQPGSITLPAGTEAALVVRPEAEDQAAWTLIETRLPETVGFVPTLACFPRAWRSQPPAWSPGGELRDVRVEHLAFERRFLARIDARQDDNWLLQLLSPAFIVWLTDAPHAEFGFELHEGVLRCFRPGALDPKATAAFAAEAERVHVRIRDEVAEAEGLGVRELGSGIPERIERAVAGARFDSTPASSQEAARAFRGRAARDPRVYISALGGIVGGLGVLLAGMFEFGFDLIGVIIEIVELVGPQNSAVALGIFAVIAWLAALPEAIKIASQPYGRVAFARLYAAGRGLASESPQSFHRRLLRLELPAPAWFVMRGAIAPDIDGRLVLCVRRRLVLHSHFDAVVLATRLPETAGAQLREGLEYRVAAGHLAVWRSASPNRDAEGLERFCVRAGALRERLEAEARIGDPGGAPAEAGATPATAG